jgi:tight adherence protein B
MTRLRMPRAGRRLVVVVALAYLLCLTAAGPSWAASLAPAAPGGSIDYVEPKGSAIRVLYSINGQADGARPDLSSLEVSIDGVPVRARAELAAEADADATVRRTTILAIDVSRSMRGERFEQAKLAAREFLGGVSADVHVGIVTFARDVTTVQEPSLDRAESMRRLHDLSLTLQTRLYDGLLHAVRAAGDEGQRSVLVLSDGADTSDTALREVTSAVAESGVQVDVVALAQASRGMAALEEIATAGHGAVLPAGDPAALTELFSEQAAELARQVLVTARVPAAVTAGEGTLSVSLRAGDEVYTDTAFVPLPDTSSVPPPASEPQPVTADGFITETMMLGGLAAAGLGILLLLLSAFGVFSHHRPATLEDRIAAYSRTGRPTSAGATPQHLATTPPAQGVTSSAVGMAEKALANNAGVAASVNARLEAAGMSLKPAEWVLMHAGIALGSGLVGLLLGGAATMVLLLVVGAVLPWLYLSFQESKRLSKFNAQLADTLQLIAGGLSAGLSFAQSIDTVVRQGSEPMTSEFKRALIEARLGVDIEDALESIGERMKSQDFTWVVIAVRIQREVGGNLAEVLGQVAATIREREYLHRQVKSLSAEGKMSAWILGLLPVVVFVFLMFTNGDYFAPMFGNILGFIMLGAALLMMTIAVVWMRKLVRMEV